MKEQFEMVAKTLQGLEDVLADELKAIGAQNIQVGRRVVSFEGDKEVLYKANLCCRTALRILKPICKFIAHDTDSLYEMTKEFDWTQIITVDDSIVVDTVAYSDIFNHTRFVTYRIKDAIVDHFKDRFGADKRPNVRLEDADVMINVHIDEDRVTISLDSSGESLHRRGYRVAQNDAPINEVLAAGIILKSGWNGQTPLIDPMCGSGTFLIEAALIAANINPGVFRTSFAFEKWKDFDQDLFDRLYNDDSNEREVTQPIIGADISPKAIAITQANMKQAGVAKYIDLHVRPIADWTAEDVPGKGYIITNPPYGERIMTDDMDALYTTIGSQLKHVFTGFNAWIIGFRDEHFKKIGLAASSKTPMLNGSLECELREYIIFDGEKKAFRREGGSLKSQGREATPKDRRMRRKSDQEWKADARKKGFGGKESRPTSRKPFESRNQDRPKSYTRREFNPAAVNSENPLAARRNEELLERILNRSANGEKKTAPATKRGWKRNTPKNNKPDNND